MAGIENGALVGSVRWIVVVRRAEASSLSYFQLPDMDETRVVPGSLTKLLGERIKFYFVGLCQWQVVLPN